MSDKKQYSAKEAAEMVRNRVKEVLKKHSRVLGLEEAEEILAKANSAHEIDPGQEPKDDNAECPPSLGGASEKSEHSEERDMEDQPLQSSEDDEEKEEKKKDKKEDEDSEEGYDFKKSESGMHTIQYKRLAKKGRCWDGYEPVKGKKPYSDDSCKKISKDEDGKFNPSFDREKKDVEWTGDQKKMIDSTKPGKIKSSRKDQSKFIEEAKQRRQKMREQGLLKEEHEKDMDKCGDMKKDEGMSVEQAVSMIMSDKHGVNDVMDKVPKEKRNDVLAALRDKDAKKAEMCKGYMDKCGDMKVMKSEVSSEKLVRFLKKNQG